MASAVQLPALNEDQETIHTLDLQAVADNHGESFLTQRAGKM